jgi:hypothetical protein
MTTLTAALNANLGLIATVTSLIVLGVMLYRVARILCGLLIDGLLFTGHTRSALRQMSALKRFAQMGVVGYALQFVALLFLSAVRLLAAAFRAGLMVAYLMLPILVLSCVLVLLHERWSESMLVLTDIFNGSLGTTLRALLIAPLVLLDAVGTHVLPVFNLVVFVVVQVPGELLMWLLRGEGATHLMLAAREVGAMGSPFMASGKAFVTANSLTECPLRLCSNTTSGGVACVGLSLALRAEACLDPVVREMDLVPVAVHGRKAAAHVLMSLGSACHVLGMVLNVTGYPLTDPSAWYAADRAVNALLSALVAAPTSAALRCAMAGGIAARPAMCTPDVGHAWALAAEAALHLGDALTHWFDAAYLLVFDARTIQTACATGADFAGLWVDPTLRRLMGANATALVRLTSTAFALTDGHSVVYVHQNPLRHAYAPHVWPLAVNPLYGIARVRLPSGVDATDGGFGLMGCACEDVLVLPAAVRTAVQLRCAIVTRSGDAWVLPLQWSLAAEAQLLSCSRLRVNVQSIRWPQRRAVVRRALPGLSAPSCLDTAACVAADAAVYVTPLCGAQDGRKALACLPEKSFTRGICFPYCLALRMQHEAFRPLTIRGAREWTEGVVMAARDCSAAATATATETATTTSTRTVCTVRADVAGSAFQLTEAQSAGDAPVCGFSSTCTSTVDDKTSLSDYNVNSSLPTLLDTAAQGVRLILEGQPMVIAGGVQMRAFTPNDPTLPYGQVPQSYADFPSLVGNQVNEFSIEPDSPAGIPITLHPPSVPSHQAPLAVLPTIDLPPTYAQVGTATGIPYNPAALSTAAMWLVLPPFPPPPPPPHPRPAPPNRCARACEPACSSQKKVWPH